MQVRALTPVSVLTVDRGNFTALMGPLLSTMVKRAEAYLLAAVNNGSTVFKQPKTKVRGNELG